MITYITYSIANDYYMHYLAEKSKTRKLKTDNEKLESRYYLTSQFQQVTPFSPFHCASTVRQTKRRRALNVRLTHSNRTEMAYQVMRDIAENGCTYTPIDQYYAWFSLDTYQHILYVLTRYFLYWSKANAEKVIFPCHGNAGLMRIANI